MKLSHEVPIQLLEKSLDFNDYDYSLVHMLVENMDYYNFYKTQSKYREQILDNSAYELKDSFNPDIFADYVGDIKPTYYIIPDKIADYEATINYFNEFIKKYSDLPGKKIGVVQGTNENEFIDCFKFMNDKCDKVAIPFHSLYYNIMIDNQDININRVLGRIKAIEVLRDKKLIKKPIHLLGCSLPQEFYNIDKNIVESIDTSNPIVLGIDNKTYDTYGETIGLSYKPINMVDYYATLSNETIELIGKNVKLFRNIFN